MTCRSKCVFTPTQVIHRLKLTDHSISQKMMSILPIKLALHCGHIALNRGDCTARQCLPLWRKFVECSIINPGLSLLMKHLVIGQRKKAPDFSAFHWPPHGSLLFIGQHFITTRVVHLPKRNKLNCRIGPKLA